MIRSFLALAVLFAAMRVSAADRWRISYFYDKADETFDIADMKCPGPTQCIAVGALEREGRFRPHGVITTDSGAHWTPLQISEVPVSLFFLSTHLGWMVTDKGIWQSSDGGETWKRISFNRGLQCVYFLNESHGFAAGAKQALLETSDGGARWTPVGSIRGLTAKGDGISFEWIFFRDARNAIVIGEAAPEGARNLPAWLEPERARSHEARNTILLGRTTDGGANWSFSPIPRSDDLINVRMEQQSLWLVFQPSGVEAQSEIDRLDWDTGSLTRIAEYSAALIADATRSADSILVAAIVRQGRLMEVPIPGKLRILAGPDFGDLASEDVDYRATAAQVRFAVAPGSDSFLATDTGMILKLVHQP